MLAALVIEQSQKRKEEEARQAAETQDQAAALNAQAEKEGNQRGCIRLLGKLMQGKELR